MIHRGLIAFFGVLAIGTAALAEPMKEPPSNPTELFKRDAIWNIHLRFTAEQWKAMEPTGGGGPGGFNIGAIFAPTLAQSFLTGGDGNGDGKLSREEFAALGDKWFAAWDKEKKGSLRFDQLREGLSAVTPVMTEAFRLSLQGAPGKRNGVAAMMGVEFHYVHGEVDVSGQTFKDVGVRFKGNGTFLESRQSPKRSIKVKLNHYVKGQAFAGVTTLNLQNNVTDPSEMNEVLAYRLYRDAGIAAPRTAYARVYVTAGKEQKQYLGLYSISENVDKEFLATHFGDEGGALFKPVTPELFGDLGKDWKGYVQTYDPKTPVKEKESARLIELCRLCAHANDAEFAEKIGQFIDVEQFARYMAVTVWLTDLDGILGPGQNFYLHLNPKSQRFTFIPWDQDHSFGRLRGTQEQREKLSISKPWTGQNRFLERMFKLEQFEKAYRARLAEFSKTLLVPQRFHEQVDELAKVLRPAVKEESEQHLKRFDMAVSGKQETGGFLSFLAGPPDREKAIKGFVDARTPSLIEQLADKSKGLSLDPPPGQKGGFRPGMFFAPPFLTSLDTNHDGAVSREEFSAGFAKWFDRWRGKSEALTLESLTWGVNQDLTAHAKPPSPPPPQKR